MAAYHRLRTAALYTSASQTFLCCGPATSSAEAVRPFVIKFQFKKLDMGGAYIYTVSSADAFWFYFHPGLGHLFSLKFEALFYTQNNVYLSLHGDSIKTKPNCFCHIYLILYHIIIKLSRYLDNSTRNMIPTYQNILFNR